METILFLKCITCTHCFSCTPLLCATGSHPFGFLNFKMVCSSFLQYSFLPSLCYEIAAPRKTFCVASSGFFFTAELGRRHLLASLNFSPFARHVRVSGNVMACVKLARWGLPVLLGPEAARTDVVPRWLLLLPLHIALSAALGGALHIFVGGKPFSSISRHSSLVGLW